MNWRDVAQTLSLHPDQFGKILDKEELFNIVQRESIGTIDKADYHKWADSFARRNFREGA